jgi:prepilin-type N-terminal cleavage/methylation domain-containing protein
MLKKSEQGFTLIEVMISVFLTSIVASVAFYLMYFFYLNYHAVQGKLQTEQSLVQSIYQIQRVLSLAVDVKSAPGSLNGAVIALGQPGEIRDLAVTSMGGTPGQIDTMAIFLREKGGYQAAPNMMSEYAPAAIFYARPSPTKSGVVFLDVNSTGVMSPDFGDSFFDKVVEFSITNFISNTTPTLTSVELSITMRSFLESNPRGWNFCPQADITAAVGGCSSPLFTSFKDINRKVRVTFSNQVIRAKSPRFPQNLTAPYERTFGQIYLFPTIY